VGKREDLKKLIFENNMDVESARLIAAGIAVGLGAIGPAIGEGMIAAKAMEAIGRNPEVQEKITPLVFVTMAIAESTAIYALVVALVILFV
jgi:F-type H+-transporting ATPase subunit c